MTGKNRLTEKIGDIEDAVFWQRERKSEGREEERQRRKQTGRRNLAECSVEIMQMTGGWLVSGSDFKCKHWTEENDRQTNETFPSSDITKTPKQKEVFMN